MAKRQLHSSDSSDSFPDDSASSSESDVPHNAENTRNGRLVIRVHNLTRNVTIKHIHEIFGRFGTIKEVDGCEGGPICDFPKGRSTIEYSTNEEAIEAFANMKGAQIDGEEVNVSLIKITARPKVETRP
eukprot:EG_transcript_49064